MSNTERFQALKGMKDILPPDILLWQHIERTARELFQAYGFQEVRTPVVEPTGLFTRSIGVDTDIVEKEMYTFQDKGERSVSLRPEGTASLVRCYVEHNLHTLPSPQKYYYSGAMFRYERPQAGRFRQFHQIGVEAYGSSNPEMDAEILSMLRHFLIRLGLGTLSFQVNSIGCAKCRPGYRETLLAFFQPRLDRLCPDCMRRYQRNPLRILDCKVDRCRNERKAAPKVTDHLCPECDTHFKRLLSLLSSLGVPAIVNPDMVRGLDYYTRTTFEVTSEHLGAQNTVAAGGRYDRLVKEFGGPETPAIGFALGMERLVELLKGVSSERRNAPDLFIAAIGDTAFDECMLLADRLRIKGVWVELGEKGTSLKSQLRRADRLSAEYVLIIGDEEISSAKAKWKRFTDSTEGVVPLSDIDKFFSRDTPHSRM